MDNKQIYFTGIDIGSTASKTVVLKGGHIVDHFVLPTGWNGRETAETIHAKLTEKGYADRMRCVATGYGRICVDYADKIVTEITCHGRGGWAIFQKNTTIIDVGGQDTKIIKVIDGQVADFLMNDKCAAGTGKFIEVMSTRLGTSLEDMYRLAGQGSPLAISAMCTVFAESEVISHIGAGEKREDIAAGVIHSVVSRVANLALRFGISGNVTLTGGLCGSPYFIQVLSEKLGVTVETHPFARYAGALGAALTAAKIRELAEDDTVNGYK
ncbi:MAG: acyl-CoA dehydratase activase [Coprococcus sp.]